MPRNYSDCIYLFKPPGNGRGFYGYGRFYDATGHLRKGEGMTIVTGASAGLDMANGMTYSEAIGALAIAEAGSVLVKVKAVVGYHDVDGLHADDDNDIDNWTDVDN